MENEKKLPPSVGEEQEEKLSKRELLEWKKRAEERLLAVEAKLAKKKDSWWDDED